MMALLLVVIFLIHMLNNQVQSTVNYCIYCNGCSTPNNGILANLNEEACDASSGANDLCYVNENFFSFFLKRFTLLDWIKLIVFLLMHKLGWNKNQR